jgi:myosin heavy subunit
LPRSALIENNLVGILALLDEQCRISKESHEPLVAA